MRLRTLFPLLTAAALALLAACTSTNPLPPGH
jgi:outer membrane biogenesis lipoprotein LolB